MPTNYYLQTLLQLDKSPSQFPNNLRDVLGRKEFDESTPSLRTDDLVEVVEYLDKVLNDLDPASLAFGQILRRLQEICKSRMFVPSSHVLRVDLLNTDKSPFASGGFSDVFQGTYGGSKVCVKRLRVSSTSSPERMLHREALIWKRLIHANIVPFTGVTFTPLQIVSEWMSGGDLTTHIKSNPLVSRITLLLHVAKGLNYLHNRDVVHGDLKGPNIMVDAYSCARITDFGLARNKGSAEETYVASGGTARWTAPEILKEQGTSSKGADVFSFAMVMVEAFTGSAPFSLHPSISATVAMMRGERPPRPIHPAFTRELWTLMQRCWSQEPDSRPDMSEVLRDLHNYESSQPTIYRPDQQLPRETMDRRIVAPRSTPRPKTISAPSRPRPSYGIDTEPLKSHSRSAGRRVSLASSPAPLNQLLRLDRSSSEFHNQFSNIICGDEYKKCVPTLRGDDLVWLVEYLNETLDTLDPASFAFLVCLHELKHICGARTILPTSYTFPPQVLNIGRQPVASGSYGDVYEGTLNDSRVSVKRVKIYSKGNPKKATKTLYQEVVVWKRLDHKNIVPLLGITSVPLQLVSEWMPGGDLTEYIRKHPDADRLGLLSDVAEGLHFLHSCSIIHGDLKGSSILVDAAHHARITDFGLAPIAQSLDSTWSTSDDQGRTVRWAAPEILNGQGTYSKEADIFSLAMATIELFTGAVPFNNTSPAAVMSEITAGKRPPRPTHPTLTDELWALIRRCWDQDPRFRPEVSEVLKVLHGSLTSVSSPTIGRLADHKRMASPPSSPHSTSQISHGNTKSNGGSKTTMRDSQRRNRTASEPSHPMLANPRPFGPARDQYGQSNTKTRDGGRPRHESRQKREETLNEEPESPYEQRHNPQPSNPQISGGSPHIQERAVAGASENAPAAGAAKARADRQKKKGGFLSQLARCTCFA